MNKFKEDTMRKWFKLFASAALILSLILGSYATVVAKERKTSFEDSTLGEVEQILIQYLKDRNLNYEVGSQQYFDFLMDQLVEEQDKDLINHPQYRNIRTYAAIYVKEAGGILIDGNGEPIRKAVLDLKLKDETIKQIMVDIKNYNDSVEKKIKEQKVTDDEVSMLSTTYNASAAATYAQRHATSYNREYKTYLEDCTNFVSQAVHAGGKKEAKTSNVMAEPDIKKTTSFWYSDRYEEWHTNHFTYKWKETSSWIGVDDFRIYWSGKGIVTKNYTTRSGVKNYAAVGDVIQLQNSSGTWYHSIIVSKKENGKLYYCGHSRNRLNQDFDTISETGNKFRVIKFAGTTN